jgi:hypothetical protein
MDEIIELLYLSRVYLFLDYENISCKINLDEGQLIFEIGFILSGFINFPIIILTLSNPMLGKLNYPNSK